MENVSDRSSGGARRTFSFDEDPDEPTGHPFLLDDEDSEWLSSKIRGFTFGDDDQTPFEDLAKFSSGQADGPTSSGVGMSATSRIVSDRVRAASAAYASFLDRHERGVSGLSISEAIGDASNTDVYVSNDPSVLRSELIKAKRHLDKLSASRFVALHPKETVRNIFLGNLFSLEFYKSLSDKTALIDEALQLGDGNTILTAILFLRQTLSRGRLLEVLRTRPAATKQLLSYLEARNELPEIVDLLTGLGRYHEAGLAGYRQAILSSAGNTDSRITRLRSLLSSPFFQGHQDSAYLIEHINLLERMQPVISSDAKNAELAAKLQLPDVPRLERMTVLQALLYCAYHHWKQGDNLLHSAMAMKKMHKLSDKQYTWVCLVARAKCCQWADCHDLAVTKGWLGGRKTKADIQPDKLVQLLHNHGAPGDVLQAYLALIDSLDDREALAKKVSAHTVVIDVYVMQRDRAAIQKYQGKLVPQSSEWLYADNALNASNCRWKN